MGQAGVRAEPREIVTVTTNVPAPQPLYGLGCRLLEIIPYVPIANTVRTSVAIFTYCDNVTFGITGDLTANPVSTCLLTASRTASPSFLAAAGTPASRPPDSGPVGPDGPSDGDVRPYDRPQGPQVSVM